MCTICSEVLETDLVVTPCGHVYHEACLRRWTDRVPTCPQCRRKVPDVRRLFPNLGRGPDVGMEPAHLAAHLDDTRLELRTLQEQLRATCETLQREQAEGAELRARLVSTEKAVVVLRQQAAHYKRLAGMADKERERANGLQLRVDQMEKLKNLMHAGVDDVERLLAGEPDMRTLATFSVALRRALADAQRERAAYRTQLQQARRDVSTSEFRLRRLEQPGRHEPAMPSDTVQATDSVPAAAPAPSSANSPYLHLRQAGPALALSVKVSVHYRYVCRSLSVSVLSMAVTAALFLQPSEQPTLALRATPYSIFGGRGESSSRSGRTLRSDRYDGLGGRAPPESVPVPAGRARPPRLSTRHRLRAPTKET